jgi:hypothetical protein
VNFLHGKSLERQRKYPNLGQISLTPTPPFFETSLLKIFGLYCIPCHKHTWWSFCCRAWFNSLWLKVVVYVYILPCHKSMRRSAKGFVHGYSMIRTVVFDFSIPCHKSTQCSAYCRVHYNTLVLPAVASIPLPPGTHKTLRMLLPDKYIFLNLQMTEREESRFYRSLLLKGIVSRDFEVCFLIPLNSSDIATPSGVGSFFLKVDFVLNFRIFGPWR